MTVRHSRLEVRTGRFGIVRERLGLSTMRLSREDREDRAILEKARQDLDAGRLETITLDELKTQLGD